jgi:hypothetical protein
VWETPVIAMFIYFIRITNLLSPTINSLISIQTLNDSTSGLLDETVVCSPCGGGLEYFHRNLCES